MQFVGKMHKTKAAASSRMAAACCRRLDKIKDYVKLKSVKHDAATLVSVFLFLYEVDVLDGNPVGIHIFAQ